jgi:transcriptional regulator with XRE-family HTH domain
MLFADRIRRLRDEKQMLQRQFAVELRIDTPMYSEIERGECYTQREQVIAKTSKVNRNDFLIFGRIYQVTTVMADVQKIADKALQIAKNKIKIHEHYEYS